MFFRTTRLKRKSYKLLTMHKTVREEFKKQLESILYPESLSLSQEGEIVLFLGFTILKSIEIATSNKQDFTDMSGLFLDFLLDNKNDYGVEDSLKEFVLKGIVEGRFGEYEKCSLEEMPKFFINNVGLQDRGVKDKDINEAVEVNFLITFKEGKKIIR